MAFLFPRVKLGDALRAESLAVFPLFVECASQVDYRLSHEALEDQSIVIEEVNEGGSVPDLLVVNRGEKRILFLEGEQLIGAKQNRILNASLLVPARSTVKIPVSCVEQGRWRYISRQFGSSKGHAPSKLRSALKASVHQSIEEHGAYVSDQQRVWAEVAALNAKHQVQSRTAAMADAFEARQDILQEMKKQLPYVDGAAGLVITIGNKVVSADLFDKPSTCQKLWDRLISGGILDAVGTDGGRDQSQAVLTPEEVMRFLARTVNVHWEKTVPLGEGEEYRSKSEQGEHGSALLFEGELVHGSLVSAPNSSEA